MSKIQVGDGDSDHYCWERAEDMTTPRNAFKIDSTHPGSDLAGETAAAMAAASMAFKLYNSSYSSLLLAHSKQVRTKKSLCLCSRLNKEAEKMMNL